MQEEKRAVGRLNCLEGVLFDDSEDGLPLTRCGELDVFSEAHIDQVVHTRGRSLGERGKCSGGRAIARVERVGGVDDWGLDACGGRRGRR